MRPLWTRSPFLPWKTRPDRTAGGYLPRWHRAAWSTYILLGSYRVRGLDLSRGLARFRLEEKKARSRVDVPAAVYTREAYPQAADSAVGQARALVLGTVLRVPGRCVDAGARVFEFAGHALARLEGLYVDGEPAAPAAVDLAAGRVSLAAWDGVAEVTADLVGLAPSGNPADVLAWLLAAAGETDLDAESWAAARAGWVLGTTAQGAEVAAPAVGLALTEARDAWEVVGEVQAAARALLYPAPSGAHILRRWEPLAAAGALELVDGVDLAELRREDDAADRPTRVVARYAIHHGGGLAQVVEMADEEARLRLGLTAHATLEVDLPFLRREDAEAWASRELALRARPRRTWAAKANARALALAPGDRVVVRGSRWGDLYLEVLERAGSPVAGWVELVLSDWRGFGDRGAWVTEAAPAFPTELGGGSAETWAEGWTAAQKAYARRNLAFVADPYGFADPTDPESYLAACVS